MSSDTQFATYTREKQAHILIDFMDLFRGNDRGYGVGEFQGARQRETDNKWTPGHVRWTWGKPGEEQYRSHLAGDTLVGIGVLCDDGRVWFTCLDIDDYDIDYHDVMSKIKRLNLPLVVFRTKSGGLRICLFFSEPVEAELAIERMHKLAASLGYSGCEIFPKQTKLLVDKGDCPSWIYLPYSGTGDAQFSEAGAMNEMGNLMNIDEAMRVCKKNRIDRSQFMNLFSAEKAADANGKKNGKKRPDRIFMEEGTKNDLIDEIFHDGPVCLRILSRLGVGQGQQNYFLAHCATFLKKKYENWDKALVWVNYNVLMPVGDKEKLDDIVRRWENGTYEYLCHNEPMQSYCDTHGCRNKKYGVGSGGDAVRYPDLGMTIVNRKPPLFIISVGESRITMDSTELLNQNMFQTKFLEEQVPIPLSRKKDEHIHWINVQMSAATRVEPTSIMRTNAAEIEMISAWFGRVVPPWIKRGMSDDKSDKIRVKEDERRIYFKWDRLVDFIRRVYSDRDVKAMRTYVDNQCEQHSEGRGHWWRFTYSISFDRFDEEEVSRWLNPE